MAAENGSGGQISDVTFTGGAFGLWGGEQQFTSQRLKFSGCTIGVQVIWGWGWVWKSIVMTNVGTGFKFVPEADSTGNVGSASILDSSFTGVTDAIVIAPPRPHPGLEPLAWSSRMSRSRVLPMPSPTPRAGHYWPEVSKRLITGLSAPCIPARQQPGTFQWGAGSPTSVVPRASSMTMGPITSAPSPSTKTSPSRAFSTYGTLAPRVTGLLTTQLRSSTHCMQARARFYSSMRAPTFSPQQSRYQLGPRLWARRGHS